MAVTCETGEGRTLLRSRFLPEGFHFFLWAVLFNSIELHRSVYGLTKTKTKHPAPRSKRPLQTDISESSSLNVTTLLNCSWTESSGLKVSVTKLPASVLWKFSNSPLGLLNNWREPTLLHHLQIVSYFASDYQEGLGISASALKSLESTVEFVNELSFRGMYVVLLISCQEKASGETFRLIADNAVDSVKNNYDDNVQSESVLP